MADLLTFVDIQTQAPQQTVSNSENNNSGGEPGVFDALINEYTAPENLETESENIQTELNEVNEEEINLIAFKGSKLFSSSVIDILAGSSTPENLKMLKVSDKFQNLVDEFKNFVTEFRESQPEVFYDDEEFEVNQKILQLFDIPLEELKTKLNSLPEDIKAEIKNLIDEINNALENGEGLNVLKSYSEKLMNIIGEQENKLKAEAKKFFIKDEDSDSDENKKTDDAQEPEINFENAAGVVVAPNADNKISDAAPKNENEDEKNFDAKDSLVPRQNSKNSVQNQRSENKENKIEVQTDVQEKPLQKFEELIKNRTEKNSQSESKSETENKNNQDFDFNQDENHNGSRENFSGSRNGSRSRNETRRISNESSRDNERISSTTTHRTDSRNEFQNFYEGILNSRRASSTSTSQPLNIRENFNLNQSETLRNGLVNVVRFIRADGVQKASVVIDPPALGRISVELTSSSSGVEASIKVASEQIRQLIQDQLTQLRMNLSEQGVQVAEFTVDVQQDNQQGGNSQGGNQQDGRENFTAGFEEDDDTEEFRVDLEEGLLYWVA